MRVGVLTGGGDCPGLNAAIRAVVKRAELEYGDSVIGFKNGWRGAAEGDFMPLTRSQLRNMLPSGGTILGTARFHPSRKDGSLERVARVLEAERVEALVCIGGDGTLKAANRVSQSGVKVVGIPKTIDNDVVGTELSIGFHTGVSIATEAIDRLHTTAESHNRIMVVEVMGHHAGWIAVGAGIAGGADVILIPEVPFDIDEVADHLSHRHRSHANFSIVAVAEGAVPAPGTSMDFSTPMDSHGSIIAGSIGSRIGAEIASRTGFETRVTVLGHVQRGGTPTASDRILGSRFGVAAVDAIHAGRSGVMTALETEKIALVPLKDIAGKLKTVPDDLIAVAQGLV
ncbi:MAG: 6-phosphofructokinase [Micrococcales bacterium]|nr:6-phosphofructokinase [Micrococcales bacterium]